MDGEVLSQMSLTANVISIDAEAKTAKVKIVLSYGNESEEEIQESKFEELNVPDDVAALSSKCAETGGTVESVTVPAGTFDVCTVKQVDEANGLSATASKGMVALGLVKVSTDTPMGVMNLELHSFQYGQ
jgi:uncharacterized protein with GYD domain